MRRGIVTLALCVSVIGWGSLVRAEDFSLNFNGAMNQLTTAFAAQNTSVNSVKGLIQTYCDVVFASPGFIENGFEYSARQSAFVYFLCNNVGKQGSVDVPMLFADSKNFKLGSRKELGLQDIRTLVDGSTTKTDFCSLDKNLSQCNISKYVPKLFTMIINDYVNLKQPNLYGFVPGGDTVAAANTFSKAYFNGLEICNKDGERLYPDSCKALKKYITDAQKTIADVKIFKTDVLLKANIAHVCEPTHADYSLLLCGLYGDSASSLQRFLNLAYNEMFYFDLFAQYYSWMITTRTTEILKIPMKEVNGEVFTRTTTMANELTRSQEALSLSLRMMRDSYTSFPLHIGFLMYQEDLQNFAKPFGKLYTPLSQLYYTLKNVQKKE